MKKTIQEKGLLITTDLLERAKLGDEIRLSAADGMIMLTNTKMTAMDVVNLIDVLSDIVQGCLSALMDNCGECEECDHCKDLDFEGIHLSAEVLAIAGIPENTTLNAFVEEDGGIIHIEPAEYDYDIADVPPHLLQLFMDYGICLGELDALLVRGDLLHG